MRQAHRVRVLLTVDTEFSIGGAFDKPDALAPVGARAVELASPERSEGLGFLLGTLNDYALRATFFVETANSAFFGPGPIGGIIKQITDAGQDAQMHLHPCWRTFRDTQWSRRVAGQTPSDSLAEYSAEEITEMILDGNKVFAQAGADTPVALRAGNLQVGRNVYTAMKQAGITIGSNIGLAMFEPTDGELRHFGGCHTIDGITEVPVLSYRELELGDHARIKTLTIIGASFAELRYLLRLARDQQVDYFVILTHPSEFALYEQPQITNIRANRRTQSRLRKLCKFLTANSNHYENITFSDLFAAGAEPSDDAVLKVPLRYTARRLAQRLLPYG